jgi:hypothetical protein
MKSEKSELNLLKNKPMVQMKSLMAAALLGTALFASCRKDHGNMVVTPDASPTESTGVSYKMSATTLDTNNLASLINFTSGYVRVTELHFEANRIDSGSRGNGNGNSNGNGNGSNGNNGKGNGNAYGQNNQTITHVHYMSNTAQVIDLFNPTLLGNVNIPYGTYDNILFKLKIAPQDSVHALYLAGTVGDSTMSIPVYVIIDQQMELVAKWMQKTTISSGTNYLSNLSMSLGQLTSGLDSTMLQNLTLTNGAIVISSTSNTAIYNFIVTNMQSMLRVKF